MPLTSEEFVAALGAAEVRAQALLSGSVQARVVSGPRGQVVELPPAAVDELLSSYEGPESRRIALTSFARGVAAALAEPTNSTGAEESFASAAATLTPSLEGPLFASGAFAAGADTPFLVPFAEGVAVAYQFELDLGVRLIRESQVALWGVHPNRIEKAALSILFHRSWGAETTPVEDGSVIERYGLGDGNDAARALVLDNLFFSRCRDGLTFAAPASDALLIADGVTPQIVEAVGNAAERLSAASDCPLPVSVMRYVDGRLA